jgi:hypothetical protein
MGDIFTVKNYTVCETGIENRKKDLYSTSYRESYSRQGVIVGMITNHPMYGIVYRVVFSGDMGEAIRQCVHLTTVSNRINESFTRLTPNSSSQLTPFENNLFSPGDVVVVIFPNGMSNDTNFGVILGSYPSINAQSPWKSDGTIAHYSSIMGLEQKITNTGSYSITFNGPPKNWREMLETKEIKKVLPVKDTVRGGTELRFLEDGSFIVSDNRKNKDKKDISSKIIISKQSSTISIVSSSSAVIVNGTAGSVNTSAKTISINTVDGQPKKINDKEVEGTVNVKTENASVEATKTFKVKSPKISIGKDDAELLTLLVELIDVLGGIQVITPMGPANPFQTDVKSDWTKISKIKDKIKSLIP